MFIIVTGTPLDGFRYYGPFKDRAAAIAWAGEHLLDAEWWSAMLRSVEPS